MFSYSVITMPAIALASFLLTLIVGKYAIKKITEYKLGQTVRDDGPKSHLTKQGTPTMGGIMNVITLIVLAPILSIIALYFSKDLDLNLDPFKFLGILTVGSLAIGGIGFLDDFLKLKGANTRGLRARHKMLSLISVSGIIMYFIVYHIMPKETILNIFGLILEIPQILKMIIGMLVIIATANAVNLTDGIDGLAASVGSLILLGLTVIAFKLSLFTEAIFASIILGTFIGFFMFNRNPAKIFMGDTGSFFLGGTIAILAILMNLEFFLLLIAIIPVIEAISVILQVASFKLTGKRIFKMAPIHHHFEELGWSEWKVVIVFSIITLIGTALSMLIMFCPA